MAAAFLVSGAAAAPSNQDVANAVEFMKHWRLSFFILEGQGAWV
jgi:hypothetical protein